MSTLLHIDSSARAGRSGVVSRGSHTRRLTGHFVDRWLAWDANARIISRDVAAIPPRPVDHEWIEAAFTKPDSRSARMKNVLLESDLLVDELEAADVIVVGAPMYNFGVPSTLKGWIDNVVRVGRTFGFDRSREGAPYWPMLASGKKLVVLSSRGDGGYEPEGPLAEQNLVERTIQVPMAYIGITDVYSVAVEWDEFSDARVAASLVAAERRIDELVDQLAIAARNTAVGLRPEAQAA